jgi:hypothetical protein
MCGCGSACSCHSSAACCHSSNSSSSNSFLASSHPQLRRVHPVLCSSSASAVCDPAAVVYDQDNQSYGEYAAGIARITCRASLPLQTNSSSAAYWAMHLNALLTTLGMLKSLVLHQFGQHGPCDRHNSTIALLMHHHQALRCIFCACHTQPMPPHTPCHTLSCRR